MKGRMKGDNLLSPALSSTSVWRRGRKRRSKTSELALHEPAVRRFFFLDFFLDKSNRIGIMNTPTFRDTNAGVFLFTAD